MVGYAGCMMRFMVTVFNQIKSHKPRVYSAYIAYRNYFGAVRLLALII